MMIEGNVTVLYKMNCPINNKEGQRRERELILATLLGSKYRYYREMGNGKEYSGSWAVHFVQNCDISLYHHINLYFKSYRV